MQFTVNVLVPYRSFWSSMTSSQSSGPRRTKAAPFQRRKPSGRKTAS